MDVQNCKGVQSLVTRGGEEFSASSLRRGIFRLYVLLNLRSAVHVDTGYVNSVTSATYTLSANHVATSPLQLKNN